MGGDLDPIQHMIPWAHPQPKRQIDRFIGSAVSVQLTTKVLIIRYNAPHAPKIAHSHGGI